MAACSVFEECGLDVTEQRLFLKGKLLKDEDSLEAARITDKATLFLARVLVKLSP